MPDTTAERREERGERRDVVKIGSRRPPRLLSSLSSLLSHPVPRSQDWMHIQ